MMNPESESPRSLYGRLSVFLPALPVFFFFLHNANYFTHLIFTTDVLILLLVYLAFAYLIFLLCRLVKLNRQQSVFLTTLLITEFLFYGVIQDGLYRSVFFHRAGNSFVLLGILIVLTGLLYFLSRSKKNLLVIFNRYLLLIFSLFLVLETALLLYKLSSGKNVAALARRMTVPVLDSLNPGDRPCPDIYHIIFDSYTNGPALKTYFNYDNELLPYLEGKGFFVADSATSNYKSTPYSIASIFNLQYLKGAEPYQLSNSANFLVGQRAYENNEMRHFLKRCGYRFSIYSQLEDKQLLTSFGVLGVNKPNTWLRNQTLERLYRNPWLVKKFNQLLGSGKGQPALIRRSMKSFHRYNLEAYEHILSDCRQFAGNQSGPPVFSYTHFMIPHDPYLVDEYGKPVADPRPENTDMEGYLRQVKYTNRVIRDIVDRLLADSTRDKIIIIQGDHGYRHYANAPAITDFGALDAVYFFTHDYHDLNRSSSLVNTYRVVINKFFGGNLPMLDRKIFGETYTD